MASRKLLERLPEYNKLWSKSSVGIIFDAYVILPLNLSAYTSIVDTNGATVNISNISNLWFFGKTMSASLSDPKDSIFISNSIFIIVQISNTNTDWMPHPTYPIIVTDDSGGFVIPNSPNFGFSDIRFILYNVSTTSLARIDLFCRYI